MYPFEFDKSIDAEYLNTMYEGDYKYIEQIFNLTLIHFPGDIAAAENNCISADIEGTRKAFHKIKSTFGFIGMTGLQENCRSMEDKCTKASSVVEIKSEIQNLLEKIKIHKLILETEYQRLKHFNSHQL